MIKILSEQNSGNQEVNRSWISSRNPDDASLGNDNCDQRCKGDFDICVRRQEEDECPAQLAINLIQGKWKMRILSRLQYGPIRLSQLCKLFPDASKKMLTQHLREMEEDGLVIRTDLSARLRHVEYSLERSLGVAVLHLISTLTEWGSQHAPTLAEREPLQNWPDE
ncbi:MAG: helix-turn-helix domain-containing protein [Terracidiphilus sp.]